MSEREKRREDPPRPGGGGGDDDGGDPDDREQVREQADRFYAAGAAAVDRALSGDSLQFLEATRQTGGE